MLSVPALFFKLVNTLVLFSWLVFLIAQDQVHGLDPFESVYTFQDKWLKGHTIKTLSTPFNQCFMACYSNQRCYSLNFHLLSSLCELNDETHLSKPAALYHQPHVIYLLYAVRDLPYCAQERALGMEDRSIPDSAITASSVYQNSFFRYIPSEGRLRNTRITNSFLRPGCWAPVSSSNTYFQVDFGRVMFVTKVATQGNEWTPVNEYVTSYSVTYSLDNNKWEDYGDESNIIKVFNGNNDASTIATNSFSKIIKARYIRIWPKTWESWVSLRVEFYGCNPN